MVEKLHCSPLPDRFEDFWQVVRRRMMAGANHPNVTAALTTIVREEGWQALYR